MNNIADVIPAVIFVSAGFGFVVALAMTTFELFGSRRPATKGYQPLRQAPPPRPTLLVQHQQQPAASANAGSLKAAA